MISSGIGFRYKTIKKVIDLNLFIFDSKLSRYFRLYQLKATQSTQTAETQKFSIFSKMLYQYTYDTWYAHCFLNFWICFYLIQIFGEIDMLSFQVNFGHQLLTNLRFWDFTTRSFKYLCRRLVSFQWPNISANDPDPGSKNLNLNRDHFWLDDPAIKQKVGPGQVGNMPK